MTTRSFFVVAALLCLFVPGWAHAQDASVIEKVRSLYVAAAYEEALAAMPVFDGESAGTELEQFRALCLLALGREPEAVTAIERLVRSNPTFLPPATETTPRMQAIFTAARSRLVPDVAKRIYGEARAAYEARNRERARGAFQRTLDLIDSLGEADKAALADLRLLASDFLALASALPAPPPPAPATETSPKTEPAAYVAPVVISEQLPPWNPPDMASRRTEYTGVLRVQIGEDGRVLSATIVRSSHPAYDFAALRAAKQWTYKPARRGGVPVAAQKDIQVRLIPQ